MALTRSAGGHNYRRHSRTTTQRPNWQELIATGAWSERVNSTKYVNVSDQAMTRVNNLIDKVKSATASRNSYELNGTASFFAMPGYDVWGTAGRWGKLEE